MNRRMLKICRAEISARPERIYNIMNINVARKLHERRYRSSPVMSTGELLNLVGSEGIHEALQNRWLVADTETGFLQLNTDGGKLQELEQACRCRKCSATACACVETVAESLSTAMPMREAFAGFGLTSPRSYSDTGAGGVTPMVTTPRSAAPTDAPKAASQSSRTGDDVVVRDKDRDYVGKVASIGQDGRMRIRFDDNDKPEMDREYNSNEVRALANTQP